MMLDSIRAASGTLCSFAVICCSLATDGAAQCSNPWLAGAGTPGVLGATRTVYASTLWDRDGAGPLPPVVVVGGDFTIAGAVSANRIAMFDPATNVWSPLGSGFGAGAFVHALQAMPNGDLIAAGTFASAGGVAASNIARWNGANWSPLGTGVNGTVGALALLPNGDLIAGGWFTTAGGVAASCIARWDGTAWAPLGSGFAGSTPSVRALAVEPGGALVAGGVFNSAGGTSAANIARWNGVTWAPLALGLDNGVEELRMLSNGDLVAGGYFHYSGPSTTGIPLTRVARWNGTAWSPLGAGVLGSAWALAELPNGELVVGCFQSSDSILRWNGFSWSSMDAVDDDFGSVRALLVLPNGDLIAAGRFDRLGGVGTGGVARWNGASWSAIGPGLTGTLAQVVVLGNGSVVGFGDFAVGQSHGLGLWNGATWAPFPVSLAGVYRIARMPNGDLLAIGWFSGPGGFDNLAHWNGSNWTTYAPGLLTSLGQYVSGLAVRPNGEVVACGSFPQRLAIWNGSAWSSLGALTAPLPASPAVGAIACTANGDLVAGGVFASIGGTAANNIARWNGASWSPLGSGVSGSSLGVLSIVVTVTELPNGDVVASGPFNLAGGVAASNIARWNGSTWSPLGTGTPITANALLALPNGDLIAGGTFLAAGGTAVNRIARWNGASWSAVGAGTDGIVYDLARRDNGDVLVGGEFLTANGMVSPFHATITTTCPAAAAVSGAGCTGSGGPNVLTATTLPWLGATFRARATGMPPSSFALIATGTTPIALPLAALFPQGLPGCTAWVLADVLDVALPTAGAVATQVALPSTPSLVGASFHQQVLPFAFDPSGNLIELTSTNALTMTLGSW